MFVYLCESLQTSAIFHLLFNSLIVKSSKPLNPLTSLFFSSLLSSDFSVIHFSNSIKLAIYLKPSIRGFFCPPPPHSHLPAYTHILLLPALSFPVSFILAFSSSHRDHLLLLPSSSSFRKTN